MEYGPYVEVLLPADLREKIKADIDGMKDKYS